MPKPTCVAILGFSAFERSAITSYFGLNPRREPAYRVVSDVDDARLVIADGDQPGVATLLRSLGRTAESVFIGDRPPAEAGAWTMRPISPAHLLRELDALLLQLDNPGSGPLPLSLPQALASGLGGLRSEPFGGAAPTRRAADADAEDQQRRGLAEARRRLQAARKAAAPPPPLRRALLVDDSEIALLFLRRQLSQYGLDSDLARHSDDALDLLSQRPYALVFVDVDLGEDSADGLTLCQQIRHRLALAGPQPLVAMVSAFHDPVDQVRGTLAGADAYLGKPLDFTALDRLLVGAGLRRLGGAAGA